MFSYVPETMFLRCIMLQVSCRYGYGACIIMIIIIISFTQGIYTYIPETNHVSREYSFAAIL